MMCITCRKKPVIGGVSKQCESCLHGEEDESEAEMPRGKPSKFELKIIGTVKEVPANAHGEPAVLLPVWKAVADAPTGLWVSIELNTDARAQGLRAKAEKRGLEAQRRKCFVFIRRRVQTKC